MSARIASIQTRFASLFFIAVLLCTSIALHAQEAPEKAAQKSSDAWLAIVDSGKYADSWDASSQSFKSAVTKDQWQGMLSKTLGPLGKLSSRKPKSATYTKTLPGAPDGEYVVVQYDSSFEHKQVAIETVVSSLDTDKQWRVAGYFIK